MELQLITLHGFRRFAEKTEIRTNGKLVALLGPNEAGKTSILRAIISIGQTDAIAKNDLTRGQDVSPNQIVISAKFRLDKDDMAAAGISEATWFTLNKNADGSRTYSIYPTTNRRDTVNRKKLLLTIEKIRNNNKLWGRLVQDVENAIGHFDETQQVLNEDNETLSAAQISTLNEFSAILRSNIAENDPKYFTDMPENVLSHILDEEKETPHQVARDAIFDRIPKILFFTNDDRLLEGSYEIESLNGDLPSALENLAKVADLDLRKLVAAIRENDTPLIAELKEKANAALKQGFNETWSQSGVHVAFEVHNNEIQVLVREEDSRYTKLAERSDGLRQFVALQAFTTRERVENPILLIDEAEMRLHYDAQADLIQMLSKQRVSPKIIYTTHSAGCLPEDLGNGVRLVDYVRDGAVATSKVKNNFWHRGSGGIEPLLFGMGAATLAFFPIRRALLTEGESDMLLLPTMLREAYGEDNLSFQIVPGLSKTSGINLPILARNGKGVAFALDYDEGGRKLGDKIEGAKFERNSIFYLRTTSNGDHQIEDFINPRVLAHAASEAFIESGSKCTPIRSTAFLHRGRLEAIAKHYKVRASDIPKTLIAYQALQFAVDHPDEPFIDAKKKAAFGAFAVSVRRFLIPETDGRKR